MHPIKQALQKRGVTQKALADHLGVSQAYVSAVLKGQKLPSADLVARASAWLDLPLDDVETSGEVGRPLGDETRNARAIAATCEALACAIVARAADADPDAPDIRRFVRTRLEQLDEPVDADDVEGWAEDFEG